VYPFTTPLQAAAGKVQRVLDVRQRHVHDRRVEHDHQLGGRDHGQREPEAPRRRSRRIARRAGVGTGTVSRHFPTKESLFEAVVLVRASGLAEQAARLARSGDPGAAFFEYFALLITEGAANLGMAEALMGAGYDLDAACLRDGIDLKGALDGLLVRAQRAGAVRADVNGDDVKALMTS
jgi:hypothetical protein